MQEKNIYYSMVIKNKGYEDIEQDEQMALPIDCMISDLHHLALRIFSYRLSIISNRVLVLQNTSLMTGINVHLVTD